MDIQQLYLILVNFRKAIENYEGISDTQDEHDLDLNEIMKLYPRSCCSLVCKFLGHYLKYELNLKAIVSCYGVFRTGGHHEWLKYENYIIDITLDQFDSKYPKVFLSTKSQFHETKFETIKESEGLIDFKHWGESKIKYYNGFINSLSILN